jgi:hypothetical protein
MKRKALIFAAVLALLAGAGWLFYVQREESRRREAYLYELAHPPESPGFRAYLATKEKLEREQREHGELAQHLAETDDLLAKLKEIQGRMEKALAEKDSAAYQRAVEEYKTIEARRAQAAVPPPDVQH